MKKIFNIVFFLSVTFMLALFTGCGESNHYTLKAVVAAGSDATYRLLIYTPQGPRIQLLASRKGVFEFQDTLSSDVMVEILTNDYTPLGMYWASAGDKIEITVDKNHPANFSLSGTEINNRLDSFLKNNRAIITDGSSDKLNDAIREYVRANTADPVSTMLMMTKWDNTAGSKQTLELWNKIERQARPAYIAGNLISLIEMNAVKGAEGKLPVLSFINQKDTLEKFDAAEHHAALLAFSDETVKAERDSISKKLEHLRKEYKKEDRLKLIDYSLDTHLRVWNKAHRDSVTYTLAWSGPGHGAIGVRELAVPRLPFYIVTDSTGTQIYRGSSLAAAVDSVKVLKP